MSPPQQPVHPIFSHTSFSGPIQALLDQLTAVEWRPGASDRLRELQGCYLAQVEHYRTESTITHEIIVLTVVQNATKDTRYVRLERFKAEEESRTRHDGKSALENSASSNTSTRLLKGKDTSCMDHAKIVEQKKGVLGVDYRLVRSFDVPHGAFTVLEAIVLGATITAVAKDYSLLHHMCLWWASTFFLASRSIISSKLQDTRSLTINPGPFHSRAGTVGVFRLVQDNGHLSLPGYGNKTMDANRIISSVANYLITQGWPQEQIELAKEKMQEDFAQAQRDDHLSISYVVSAEMSLFQVTMLQIQRESEKVQAHNRTQAERDEEERRLQSELRQRDMELEARNRENAELLAHLRRIETAAV